MHIISHFFPEGELRGMGLTETTAETNDGTGAKLMWKALIRYERVRPHALAMPE